MDPVQEAAGLDVSVIVPVFNTGEDLKFCVDSLRRQSLAAERFEVVFVDDGSTDGSGELLDEYAKRESNFVVVHQENSGWPGKPRNVGIGRARGRYLYFVDSDDELGSEALERMVTRADETHADILLGKMVGRGRAVPKELFLRNIDDASLDKHPLLDSLTCHKLFRRDFVTKHDLRFPEGRRRLEDHVFVVRAYFLAEKITVLADYPCYYLVRRKRDHISMGHFDAPSYYASVRDVIDLIEEHTEPGPRRDRLLRRSYRVEMLGRLEGQPWRDMDAASRRQLVEEIRTLATERYGPGVAEGLPAVLRVRSDLMRKGDSEGLVAQAQFEASVKARGFLSTLQWDGAAVRVELRAWLEAAGRALEFGRMGDQPLLPVAPEVSLRVDPPSRAVTKELPRARVVLVLRERTSGVEYRAALHSVRQADEPTADGFAVSLAASASIEPRALIDGCDVTDGRWDVFVSVVMCGWTKEARIGSQRSPDLDVSCRALPVGDESPFLVAPYWTDPHGNLSIRTVAPARVLAPQRTTVRLTQGTIQLDMPLPAALESPVPAELVLGETGQSPLVLPLREQLVNRRHLRWVGVGHVPRLAAVPPPMRLILGAAESTRVPLELPQRIERTRRRGLFPRVAAAARERAHDAARRARGRPS